MTKSVVFTFGRYNPPTKGHLHVFNKMTECANGKADTIVFLSHTNNLPDNPLTWKEKYEIVSSLTLHKISTNVKISNPYAALESLCSSYDNITLVVGSDRVADFKTPMSKYAKIWGAKSFNVVSAATRDNTNYISASLARKSARANQYAKFVSILPNSINNTTAKIIYNRIKG